MRSRSGSECDAAQGPQRANANVRVEKREVVAVDVGELCQRLVRLSLCLLRPHEETRDGKQRDDRKDFIGALISGARDEHLRKLRVERELRGRIEEVVVEEKEKGK